MTLSHGGCLHYGSPLWAQVLHWADSVYSCLLYTSHHNEHLGKFTDLQTQNKLIPEQIQINTKHDTIFKALNIENTQNTNTYTTITPVSYTHLDVYKRQRYRCSKPYLHRQKETQTVALHTLMHFVRNKLYDSLIYLNCPDSAIKFNMCKHNRTVRRKINKSHEEQNSYSEGTLIT